jgi:hypothetical protein
MCADRISFRETIINVCFKPKMFVLSRYRTAESVRLDERVRDGVRNKVCDRLPLSMKTVMGLLAIASLALAHHGSRVSYDLTKTVTLKGIVKEFVYVNPHVYITFEVKDDQGRITEWAAETDPPIMMANRFAWSRKYLKPGDEVTITVWPSKAGAPRGFLAKLVTADGRVTDHSEQPQQ